MSVRLTVWDGAGVIGGNKVLLEDEGRAVFLDFGTAFATMDRYFDEFLRDRTNRGLLDLKVALASEPPRLADAHVAGFECAALPVDHSVLGATAFTLRTSGGWLAYTGDLRLRGAQGHLTRAFAEHLAELRPRVLVTEGTHAGDLPGGSEHEVRERALAAVRAAPGFVVADFQPRHVERLVTFRDVARETGRKLAVLVKDAYLLDAMHAVDPRIPTVDADDTLVLYVRGKLSPSSWERAVLERFRSRRVDAAEVRAHPEGYLLALSFYELGELVEIDPPPGGIWIYSSSEAFDEEGRVNWARLKQWLAHFGVTLVGDWERARDGDPAHRGFHASGHVSGREFAELVALIRPRTLVPVHTEDPSWFKRFEGSMEVVQPERGKPIEIA